MNRLITTLAVLGIGAAGLAGGLYLGSSTGPAPTAAADHPALAKTPPAAVPVAAAVDPTAELQALRAELRALQAEMARHRTAAPVPDEGRQSQPEQVQRAEAVAVQRAAKEDRFREEPVDPGWSRERAAGLNQILDQHPALAGAAVECRSASCRVSLPVGLDGEAEALAFVEEAQGQFAQAEIFPPGPEGQGAVVHLAPGSDPDPGVDPGLQARVTTVTGPVWK